MRSPLSDLGWLLLALGLLMMAASLCCGGQPDLDARAALALSRPAPRPAPAPASRPSVREARLAEARTYLYVPTPAPAVAYSPPVTYAPVPSYTPPPVTYRQPATYSRPAVTYQQPAYQAPRPAPAYYAPPRRNTYAWSGASYAGPVVPSRRSDFRYSARCVGGG